MKKFCKVLAISLFVIIGGIFTLVGCQSSPASKVKGNISENEITVYFDEIDGVTSKTFTVSLQGIGKMSNKLVFNFENVEIANIEFVESEGNTSMFVVTPKNGGSTNVAVVHQDTNKTIGNIKINVVRKLQSLKLNDNVSPYAVLNEECNLKTIDLISLNPYNTTQTNVGFRLKNQTQDAVVSLDGKLLVTRKPASGIVTVLAYSLDNATINPVEIDVEVVEKPSLNSLTVYNLNNDAEKVYNQGIVYPIVLVGNYPSRSSISLRAQYFGDPSVKIVFEKEDNSNLDIIKLNSNEYEILSNSAEKTNVIVKVVDGKYGDVYSQVKIPVKVIDAPTKVFVNGNSENSTLNVYTNYVESVGLKLRLGVDIVDMSTSAKSEIRLAVGQNRDSFKFYYEDGQTEIDIDNDILPNNSVIYVVANEQAISQGNNTAVLSVESYRAYEAGLSVVNNVTLVGRKGASAISLNIPNNQTEVYVKNGNTATVTYSLNEGAYAENITVENSDKSIADITVNTSLNTIDITGKKQGLVYISLVAENGIKTNIIPVRVYEPLEKEQVLIKVESIEQNIYLSEINYDLNNSLEKLVIVSKHGTYVNLTSNSNGTILSSTFSSNNNLVTINSMGYLFANAVCPEAEITVNYKTLRFTANDGSAEIVEGSKSFVVVAYTALKNIEIVDDNNQIVYNASLLSNDNYLDLEHYENRDYICTLNLNLNPSTVPYDEDGISWEISKNDYISLSVIDTENHLKVNVISKGYNNFNSSFSATVYVTVRQFGKVYTRACVVTTISQKPVTSLNVSSNEVYFDFSDGNVQSQEVTVSVNNDALNKNIDIINVYTHIVEVSSVQNSDKSYTFTFTPKNAGVAEIVLDVKGLRMASGDIIGRFSNIIKVVVADGKTEQTALYVNDQTDFLKMLENQNGDDKDFRYYKLNNNLVLMQDLPQYASFNGYFASVENKHYSISNISVKQDNKNVALFKSLKNSVISDIDFYFNDVNTNVNNFACLAEEVVSTNLLVSVNLNNINVFANNININVQSVGSYNIAGVIASVKNPTLENVGFYGNINIICDSAINLSNLNVGLLTANAEAENNLNYTSYISSNNVNFVENAKEERVKGNIYVSNNITANSSSIGGLVGKASNVNISNYHICANINALNINNVGGLIGYALNSDNIQQNLTAGFVKGKNNVGGLIGNLSNSNLSHNIVEFRLTNSVTIDENNEFVYVGGQLNVGGLVGFVNNNTDADYTISQSYITSYFDYASVRGTSNVGGFVGNATNLKVIQSYAKTLVSGDNTVSNIGGFIGNASNVNLENCFYIGKNKSSNNFIALGNNTNIKVSYAIVTNNENASLFLYNENGEQITQINSQNITVTDFTNANNFISNGFNISSQTIDNQTIWFISSKYNDNYPILVIDNNIAEKNVTIQKLEEALNNFNNLAENDDKFVKKGVLTNNDSYYVLENNKDYNIENLFTLEGIDLSYSLVENTTQNTLEYVNNNSILKLTEEGVLKLRLTVKQNTNIFKDIYVVSINDSFSAVTFNDNSLTQNTLEINRGQSKNLSVKAGNSNIVLIAYDKQDYNNFTISGLTKTTINAKHLYVSNTGINSVNAIVEMLDGSAILVKTSIVININGEFVLLKQLSDKESIKIKINSVATDLSVSLTDINMTMLDEFNFNVIAYNSINESEILVTVDDNNLTYNGNSLGLSKISISSNDLARENALLLLDKVDTVKDNIDKNITDIYKLRINDKYLNPKNILSFDSFTIVLTFTTQSNALLTKTISISLSMQDLLHTSFEYFPKTDRIIDGNTTSYILLENGSNKILPGETGILAIDMYPTYANFDEIYITAVGENGEKVVVSQKVLFSDTDSNNTVLSQRFISIKPNSVTVENGLYLRKLSRGYGNLSDITNESKFYYDGTFYVMLYVPKTTDANIKYTINITTYRKDANGNMIESTQQVSKPFYLYTGVVPSVEVDVRQLGNEVVVKNVDETVENYRPIVLGKEKALNIITRNFTGKPTVNVNKNLLATVKSVGNGYQLSLKTLDGAKAGDVFTVIVTISQNVEGILIEDSFAFKLIALNFYINDIFVSNIKDTTLFDETLTLQYSLESTLYLCYNAEIANGYETFKADVIDKIYETNFLTYVRQETETVIEEPDNLKTKDNNTTYKIKPTKTGLYTGVLKSELYYYYEKINNTESTLTFVIAGTNEQASVIEHNYNINSVISTSVDEALVINTEEEFMNMQEGVDYVLNADLDLTNYYTKAIELKASSLNGNFHTITIETFSADENGNVGFFKSIKEGSFVKNLTINIKQENLTINVNNLSELNVGLFAIENNGAIYNCKVECIDAKELKVVAQFDNQSAKTFANQNINLSGFVVTNSSTGYITNSSVSKLFFETRLKANIAGFIVENNGKVAKNSVKDFKVSSYDDETIVAGFVVSNSNNAQILQSFIDNNYLATTNKTNSQADSTQDNQEENNDTDKYLYGNGIVSGFVYKNDGLVQSSYTDLTTKTNYRSSGFVFENNGTISQCNSLALADGYFSKSNTPFTGTNEFNEVNNTGIIEYSYYKSNEQDIEKYKDVLFDEPASYIVEAGYDESMFKGFDFGSNSNDLKTWYFSNNKPMLNNTNIDSSQFVAIEGGGVQKVNEKDIGLNKSQPITIYSAKKFLDVLTDESYYKIDSNSNKITVKVYMQLICDIDMEEVANNEALSKIQQATFVGGIDGNGFTIKNLSVLTASTGVDGGNYFGFFEKIGDNDNSTTKVANLTINVKEMSSSNAKKVGILAGEIQNSIIANVHLDGEGIVVSGRNSVGALTGYVSTNVEIQKNNQFEVKKVELFNVSSNVSVSAGYDSSVENGTTFKRYNDEANDEATEIKDVSYAGGLIGILDSTAKNETVKNEKDEELRDIDASNLLVNGNVNITADFAGGIFGYSNAYVYNARFEVIEKQNAQFIKGNYCAGGIVAHNGKDSILKAIRVETDSLNYAYYDKTINENKKVDTLFMNTNAVDKDDESGLHYTYLGGLVGYNEGKILVGYNKANVVNIYCQNVGGLVGYSTNTSQLEELYITSKVVGKEGGNVGGAIGSYGNIDKGNTSITISKIVDLNLNAIEFCGNKSSTTNFANCFSVKDYIENTTNTRETAKRNYTSTFSRFYNQTNNDESNNGESNEYSVNWEIINAKISYYPQILLTSSSNIIVINNEEDFRKYVGSGDTYNKTYKIANNIEFTSSINIQSFKGTLCSKDGGHYTLTFSSNQLGEVFGSLGQALIKDLDFVFSNANYTAETTTSLSSAFVKQMDDSTIQNCNFTFNQDSIDLKTHNVENNIKDTKSITATAGLIAGIANNSTISAVTINTNSGFTINISSDIISSDTNNSLPTNLYVGGIIGEASALNISNININGDINLNIYKKSGHNGIPLLNNGFVGGIIGYAEATSLNNLNNLGDTGNHNLIVTINNNGLFTSREDSNANTSVNVGGFAGYFNSNTTNNVTLDNVKLDVKESSICSSMSIVNIGGFAGQATIYDAKNIKVTLQDVNVGNKNSGNINFGGFVATLLGGDYSLIATKIENGNIYAQNIGGFVAVNSESSTITQCGTIVKFTAYPTKDKSYIAGFIANQNNVTINKCFASADVILVSNNDSSSATFHYVAGFTAELSNSSSIQHCYVVGKIVNNLSSSGFVASGFLGHSSITNPIITNSYSAITIVKGLKFSSFYGFAENESGSNITNCYYVFNNVGALPNGLAFPVSLEGLNSSINLKEDKITFNTDSMVYPDIIVEETTLVKKLFGTIEEGTALNPIAVTDDVSSLTVETGKYYILNTQDVDITIGTDITNYTIYGYNTKINSLTVLVENDEFREIDSNSYISGITVELNDSTNKYGFIEINDGSIFNCFVKGTLKNSEQMSGFVDINNGTIAYCGVNLTFDMNNSLPNVYGFANTNNGVISTCYVIGNAQNYKMFGLTTDMASGTNEIVSFVNANNSNSVVIGCYSILTTLAKNRYRYSNISGNYEVSNVEITNIRNLKENSTIWNTNESYNYGYPYLKDFNKRVISLFGMSSTAAVKMSSLTYTGSGTSENPYQINNDVSFYYHSTNSKNASYYKLTQNIDMSRINQGEINTLGQAYWKISLGFNINGNNNIIYNTDRPLFVINSTENNTINISISNLGVNGNINWSKAINNSNVGGLISSANSKGSIGVNIENCYTNVNINIDGANNFSDNIYALNVGGFCGNSRSGNNITITNSFSLGDISISNIRNNNITVNAGGFVGNSGATFNGDNYSLSTIKIDGITRTNAQAVNAYVISKSGLKDNVKYNSVISLVKGSSFSTDAQDASFDLINLIGSWENRATNLLKDFAKNKCSIKLNGIYTIGSKLWPVKLTADNYGNFISNTNQKFGYILNDSLTINLLPTNKFVFGITSSDNSKLKYFSSFIYNSIKKSDFESLIEEYGNEWEYETQSTNNQANLIWRSIQISAYGVFTKASTYDTDNGWKFTGNVRKIYNDYFSSIDYKNITEEEFNILTEVYGNKWKYELGNYAYESNFWKEIEINSYIDFKNTDTYKPYIYYNDDDEGAEKYRQTFTNSVQKVDDRQTIAYSSNDIVLSNVKLSKNFADTGAVLKNAHLYGVRVDNSTLTQPLFTSISNSVIQNCSINSSAQSGFAEKAENTQFINCKVTMTNTTNNFNYYGFVKSVSGTVEYVDENQIIKNNSVRFDRCSSEITINGDQNKIQYVNELSGFIGSVGYYSIVTFNECSSSITMTNAKHISSSLYLSGYVAKVTNSIADSVTLNVKDCSLTTNIKGYEYNSDTTTQSIDENNSSKRGVVDITPGGQEPSESNKDQSSVYFGGIVALSSYATINATGFTLSGTQEIAGQSVYYGGIVGNATASKINIDFNRASREILGKATLNATCDYGEIGGLVGIAQTSSQITITGENDYNFESTLNVIQNKITTEDRLYLNIGGYVGALDNSKFTIDHIRPYGTSASGELGNNINLKYDNGNYINVGGSVGYMYQGSEFTINVDINSGSGNGIYLKNITIKKSATYSNDDNINIGGVVGQNSSAQFKIEISENKSNVFKAGSDNPTITVNNNVKARVGGLIGCVEANSSVPPKDKDKISITEKIIGQYKEEIVSFNEYYNDNRNQ